MFDRVTHVLHLSGTTVNTDLKTFYSLEVL